MIFPGMTSNFDSEVDEVNRKVNEEYDKTHILPRLLCAGIRMFVRPNLPCGDCLIRIRYGVKSWWM